MTYKQSYYACKSEGELQSKIEKDVHVTLFLGANPDRLEQIRKSAQEVADERGWLLYMDNMEEWD